MAATTGTDQYYYVGGERVPLHVVPNTYAVRFRDADPDPERLSPRFEHLLAHQSRRGDYIDKYGLQVYKTVTPRSRGPGEEPTLEQRQRDTLDLVDDLNDEPNVDYATPAYRRDPESDAYVLTTNLFTVQFEEGVTRQQIDDMHEEYGVEEIEEVGYVENGYVLRAPRGSGPLGPVALANAYFESGLTEWATPDILQRMEGRSSTEAVRVYELAREMGTDSGEIMAVLEGAGVSMPSHLSTLDRDTIELIRNRIGRTGTAAGERRGPQSEGRYETGTDEQSTATDGQYAVERAKADATDHAQPTTQPRDAGTVGADPRTEFLNRQWHLRTAKVTDAWNTTRGDPDVVVAVADDGVDLSHPEFRNKITDQYDFDRDEPDGSPKLFGDKHGTPCAGVAVAAGERASGAAPECSLMPIRTPSGFLGSVDEARMYRWIADHGADVLSCSWGPTDGEGPAPQPDNIRTAIDYCVNQGRNGKGIPIFWAAGNGGENADEDGWAANPKVISVAASTSDDTRAGYSDWGQTVDIAAPSSGSADQMTDPIFTTDRQGQLGYTANDYVDRFGGTSSACPLAAGIGALLLSAAPNLTASEVKETLESTADKVGGVTYQNGHSIALGHGRVNALAAVQAVTGRAPTPTPAIDPLIKAPASVGRDGPSPTFVVTTSRQFSAVEVATDWRLFQAANTAERTDETFYAAWKREGLTAETRYTLPADVWDRMKNSSELFYRVHVADDHSWSNWAVSTSSEQARDAPSFDIVAGGGTGGTGTGGGTGGTTASGLPRLAEGARGDDVRTLQWLLRAHNRTLAVDGAFGPGTRGAVENFQFANGLTSTGVVDDDTWAALFVTVRQGDRGAAVSAAQIQLGVAADGIFGAGTHNAVTQFQSNHGLGVDGVVGSNTWRQLLRT